ncbi:hypothetical protein ACSTI4_24765, partial [Vibrio parahaemolyticus]
LVVSAGNISVHVIAGEALAETDEPASRPTHEREPVALSPYAAALGMVAAALGVAKAIEPTFGLNNVDLVFLTAIVGVAVTFGLYPSLFAVLLATAA